MVIKDFGMPFNDVGSDRLYSAADWQEYYKNLVGNGVVGAAGNELAVIQQTVANKTIQVDTGAVAINGAMRVIDAAFNLTVTDNTSGNPRIDRIVARLNQTERKLEIVVKQGTPGSSPSAPALTQTSTVWEISLAKIAVANGFSTIITANITDERSYMTYKDRILNDRMTVLEGEIEDVNTRMDAIDPAKYYGKYSQMSGGDGHTGSAQNGLILYSAEDNDDFLAINLGVSTSKITIPAGVTLVRFYWKGGGTTMEYSSNGHATVNLLKGGLQSQQLYKINANYSVAAYVYGLWASTPIAVTAGEYFQVSCVLITNTTSSSIEAGSIFGMEVLR